MRLCAEAEGCGTPFCVFLTSLVKCQSKMELKELKSYSIIKLLQDIDKLTHLCQRYLAHFHLSVSLVPKDIKKDYIEAVRKQFSSILYFDLN